MKFMYVMLFVSQFCHAEIINLHLSTLGNKPFLAITGDESARGADSVAGRQRARANDICEYAGYESSSTSQVQWSNDDVPALTIKRGALIETIANVQRGRLEWRGPLEVLSSSAIFKSIQCVR